MALVAVAQKQVIYQAATCFPKSPYPENVSYPEQRARSAHCQCRILHPRLRFSAACLPRKRGTDDVQPALREAFELMVDSVPNFAKIGHLFLKSCIAEETLANTISTVYVTCKGRLLFSQKGTGFYLFIPQKSQQTSSPKSSFALSRAFSLILAQETASIQVVCKLPELHCPVSLSTWLKCGHSPE